MAELDSSSMEGLNEGMGDLRVSEGKDADLKEGKGRVARFPVREGQPDCTYYLKYESCRFGMKCKFNHPSSKRKFFSSSHKVKMSRVTESDQDDLKTKEASSECIEQKEHEENLDENCKEWTDENELEGGVLESEMRGSAKKKNESNVSALFIGWWDSRNASSDESTGNVPVTDTLAKGKDKESTSGVTAQECKFFNRGGCKFGKSCKYLHAEVKPEMPSVELNFLGLPLRPGEKECPYYMRNTSCKYASQCRFHHPDPTAVPETQTETQNQTQNHIYNNSTNTNNNYNNNNYDNNINGESEVPREKPHHANQMHKSGVPGLPMVQPVQSSWQEQRTGKEQPVQYLVAPPNYMPGLIPHHPYQMPVNPYFIPFPQPPPPIHSYEEYPERPGQPDCQHFLKNGFCKYRLACKYHHPRIPQVPVGFPQVGQAGPRGFFSPVGLPLKPDQPVCVYYGRFGVCKFGPACKFDHPLNYGPSAQTR